MSKVKPVAEWPYSTKTYTQHEIDQREAAIRQRRADLGLAKKKILDEELSISEAKRGLAKMPSRRAA